MMTRIIKKTPLFFLFFAAFLFYAHMFIPHDHHTADSDVCQENKSPVPDKGTNHHRGIPFHCHAFNDLASEKAITVIAIKQIQCSEYMPGCIFDTPVPAPCLSCMSIFNIFTQPVTSGIPELSSLRAPPSFV